MKKFLKIAGVLLAVGLVAAAGVVWYVDQKYQVLWSAPVTSFAEVADPRVSMIMLLKPPLAEAVITGELARAMPDVDPWMVNYVLPNEAAVLVRPDLEQEQLGLSFFLNERRFGPIIADQGNAANFAAQMPQIQWAPEGVVQQRRGVITLDGALPVNPMIANMVKENWGIVMPTDYPEPEGGHAAEIIIDNTNGGLFLLLGTLQSSGLAAMNLPPDELMSNLLPVGIVHLKADLVSPDVAEIDLRIEAAINATEGEFGAFDFTLGLLYGALSKGLRDQNGVILEGKKKREGTVITGEYTLTGVQNLITGNNQPRGPVVN